MTNHAEFDESDYLHRVTDDGYAIVDSVVSNLDVQTLLHAIASIPTGEEVRRKRSTYGVRNLLEICPEVRGLAVSKPIRSLVTPVLGADCFAVRAIFFNKTSDANWKLGWHQDSVISVRERIDVSGFVGWSHKMGVLQVKPPADVLADMLAIRVHEVRTRSA